MRTLLASVLALLSLAGCGWQTNFKPHDMHDLSELKQLPPDEREARSQQYKRDWADCTERGYAHQTYSGSWSAYEGTGGGYGQSQFNFDVFVTCMVARGYDYTGRSPTIFGKALY